MCDHICYQLGLAIEFLVTLVYLSSLFKLLSLLLSVYSISHAVSCMVNWVKLEDSDKYTVRWLGLTSVPPLTWVSVTFTYFKAGRLP